MGGATSFWPQRSLTFHLEERNRPFIIFFEKIACCKKIKTFKTKFFELLILQKKRRERSFERDGVWFHSLRRSCSRLEFKSINLKLLNDTQVFIADISQSVFIVFLFVIRSFLGGFTARRLRFPVCISVSHGWNCKLLQWCRFLTQCYHSEGFLPSAAGKQIKYRFISPTSLLMLTVRVNL